MNAQLSQAATILEQGRLLCFPTETVYALACDATNNCAVGDIYNIKARNANTALSLLLPSLETAKLYGIFPEYAKELAKKYWPGALTLVFKKTKYASILAQNVSPNNDTIGIRIPNHPLALAILNNFKSPIVATSANISGQDSALTYDDVYKYFGDKVSIIKGDGCELKQASTVVDCTGNEPKILRNGSIIIK